MNSSNGNIIAGIAFDRRVFAYSSPGVISTMTLYRNGVVVGVVSYSYSGSDITEEVLTLQKPTS